MFYRSNKVKTMVYSIHYLLAFSFVGMARHAKKSFKESKSKK